MWIGKRTDRLPHQVHLLAQFTDLLGQVTVRHHHDILAYLAQRHDHTYTRCHSHSSHLVNGDSELGGYFLGVGLASQPRLQGIAGDVERAAFPPCPSRAHQAHSGRVEHCPPDTRLCVPMERDAGRLVEPTACLDQTEETGGPQVLPVYVPRETGQQSKQDAVHQIEMTQHQRVTHRRTKPPFGVLAPTQHEPPSSQLVQASRSLRPRAPGSEDLLDAFKQRLCIAGGTERSGTRTRRATQGLVPMLTGTAWRLSLA